MLDEMPSLKVVNYIKLISEEAMDTQDAPVADPMEDPATGADPAI